MQSKPVAIFANGDVVSGMTVKRFLTPDTVIIAADGGAELCRVLQIQPHYLLGDFDSITEDTKRFFSKAQIIERPSQDYTDLEKALDFAIQFWPETITVFAALGRRADHALGNLLLLQRFDADVPIQFVDDYGRLRLLKPGRHTLRGGIGQTVSIVSFGPVKNLHLDGFRYSAPGMEVYKDFLGVSNVYENETCHISFDEGKIFLYEVFEERKDG
ncbi:MAG TPA: thiamine diphosphokinase [Caldithrix abyssi]|uniref:Thiamine diphosphokinase n=1 Tax=Caldithrix abyssi TaxID=187145 RepID=A0A7V4WW63_CALAY|nr:thiamine diphosphokinase [Caldithrix abyssi]